MSARWNESRNICKRIIVEGDLVLLTPASFGSGRREELTDIPLLRDSKDGVPLLTGSTIAGATRAYLREWENGYEVAEPERVTKSSQKLFGDVVEGPTIQEDEKES